MDLVEIWSESEQISITCNFANIWSKIKSPTLTSQEKISLSDGNVRFWSFLTWISPFQTLNHPVMFSVR